LDPHFHATVAQNGDNTNADSPDEYSNDPDPQNILDLSGSTTLRKRGGGGGSQANPQDPPGFGFVDPNGNYFLFLKLINYFFSLDNVVKHLLCVKHFLFSSM